MPTYCNSHIVRHVLSEPALLFRHTHPWNKPQVGDYFKNGFLLLSVSVDRRISTSNGCMMVRYDTWKMRSWQKEQKKHTRHPTWRAALYSHCVYSCSRANSAGVRVTHLSWPLIVFRPGLFVRRAFPGRRHAAGVSRCKATIGIRSPAPLTQTSLCA